MALPELTSARAESSLRAFCERKVPPHARHQVRLKFRTSGNSILLFEERPYFRDPSEWIEIPIAQFRFTAASKKWQLYCRDRNTKWHRFTPEPATTDFDRLIAAVDADPTHIFWG